MTDSNNFVMWGDYNAWANAQLYAAASALTADQWRHETPVFFRSMMGTLNHILVGDRVWMKRFTGEGDLPTRLDALIHEDFAALLAARQTEDARIRAYVASVDAATLDSTMHYTPITDPTPVAHRLAPALAHMFNHQTHHRGHAHAILSILGQKPPSLDLLYFLKTPEGQRYL